MDDKFPDGMVEEIERFLESEHTRPCGRGVYDEVFQTKYFYPLQRQAELASMLEIAESRQAKIVMEIGSDKGGGLYHWCKLPCVEGVIACEIRGTPYAKAFEKAFPHIRFLWLPCSSFNPESTIAVDRWLGGQSIDCLFLDGDKGRYMTDFNVYKSRMNHNGVIFIHDFRDEPVVRAYSQLCRKYQHLEILDVSDYYKSKDRGGDAISRHDEWLRYWQGRSAGVGVIYLGRES